MIENTREISEMLKVLANENRLLIVCLLIDKEMTVSDIHEHLSHITQPALSQHLKILKSIKLLDSNKKGLEMTYFIKDKRIIELIQVLKSNYC